MERLFEDEYVQGSEAWKKMRENKIGASDIGTIMGLNPYKSALELYYEKKGLRPVDEFNHAMRTGQELEPIARELAEKHCGKELIPLVLIDKERDFLMVSLDAISNDNKIIFELKSGKRYFEHAQKGVVLPMTKAQVHLQMYVSEKTYGIKYDKAYVGYLSPDSVFENNAIDNLFGDGLIEPDYEFIVIEVERDENFMKEMIEVADRFKHCLDTDTPPDSVKGDRYVLEDVIEEENRAFFDEFNDVFEKYKHYESLYKSMKPKAEKMLNGKSLTYRSMDICYTETTGSIDYKKAAQSNCPDVDFEQFRRKGTKSYTIRLKKESKDGN